MFTRYLFHESAFKHNVEEDDIRRAFVLSRFDGLLEGYANKFLLTGFDTRGNLIEVMYHLIDEKTAYVFHAMPCRREYRALQHQQGETSMPIMTEEEADALDELLTQTTPTINADIRGVTAYFSADYITARALAARQTPEEVIHTLVARELAGAQT